MKLNNTTAVPVYSIDDFHNFLIDNKAIESSYVFVPNNTFKKELLSIIARNNDCYIPPKIISLETLGFEENNLDGLLECPLELQIIDNSSAKLVIEHLTDAEKNLSSDLVLESLEQIDADLLYDNKTPAKSLASGNARKFIEFLRSNDLHLLSHANQIVFNSFKVSTKFKVFLYQSLEPCSMSENITNKLSPIIYKEKSVKVPKEAKININTLYKSEFNTLTSLLDSEIFNNKKETIFVTNDNSLINKIKTSYLSSEEIKVLDNNVDFFRLSILIFDYYKSKSSSALLNILKLKVFDIPGDTLIEYENNIRSGQIDENIELVSFLLEQKKPYSLGELFSLSLNLIEKFCNESLYLEHALDISESAENTFSRLNLSDNELKNVLTNEVQIKGREKTRTKV
jgi:hypothetical protein